MALVVAVAVSGGVAVPVAVPVAGLTKRFFNQIDFLINVWGYLTFQPDSNRFRSHGSSPMGFSNSPSSLGCFYFVSLYTPTPRQTFSSLF